MVVRARWKSASHSRQTNGLRCHLRQVVPKTWAIAGVVKNSCRRSGELGQQACLDCILCQDDVTMAEPRVGLAQADEALQRSQGGLGGALAKGVRRGARSLPFVVGVEQVHGPGAQLWAWKAAFHVADVLLELRRGPEVFALQDSGRSFLDVT
eukprot:scaffold1596_cov302-Pinguiococcus_pyrenoidosus.AAC.49